MSRGQHIPDVLYDGTARVFAAFTKDASPRFNTPLAELGFFFTNEPVRALGWYVGARGHLVHVTLDILNPKVEPVRRSGLSFIDFAEIDWSKGDGIAYVECLRNAGHDGIVVDTPDGYRVYVASKAGQVTILKSVPFREARLDFPLLAESIYLP